jgi:hypothetical protein
VFSRVVALVRQSVGFACLSGSLYMYVIDLKKYKLIHT